MADFDLLEEAITDIDKSLETMGVLIQKAENPLKPKEYNRMLIAFGRALKKVALPIEKEAREEALKILEVSWVGLTETQIEATLLAAMKKLNPLGNKLLSAISDPLIGHTMDMVRQTKTANNALHHLGLASSLSLGDEQIGKIAYGSFGHYVTDAAKNRNDLLGMQAKQIVKDGLDKGIGSKEISKQLAKQVSSLGRSEAYWDMLAMNYANRARTLTQLIGFNDAGIKSYEWMSVLDEATTMQCRFMHGKVFPVSEALDLAMAIEDSSNPEDIKKLAPFMRHSGDELYYKIGEERFHVATVTENVIGQKDKVGRFSDVSPDAVLSKAGFRMPPSHGRCRSSILPIALRRSDKRHFTAAIKFAFLTLRHNKYPRMSIDSSSVSSS